ncbi:MAG: NifU family protein [Cytophagales bacterium]
MENKVVNIYTESNPNPNSLKFCVDFLLLPEGKSIDFADLNAARISPLATELFQFSGVKRVFYASNFVTVTKEEQTSWEDLSPILKAHIKAYLESGKKLMFQENASEESSGDEPEIVIRIKTLLDEYIRPAVEQDGGAITFHSFEEGTVKVLLQGSCSGCPSSTMTLKAGIQNLLTRMIPEVKEVIAEGI